jgi:hypothetical protein
LGIQGPQPNLDKSPHKRFDREAINGIELIKSCRSLGYAMRRTTKESIGNTGQYLVLALVLLNYIMSFENSADKLGILGTHLNNQLNPWGSTRLDTVHTNIFLPNPLIILQTNPPILLSTKYKGWKPPLHAPPDPPKK